MYLANIFSYFIILEAIHILLQSSMELYISHKPTCYRKELFEQF